ncbi:hypothetical protein ES705_13985 [subsurface metagenome]
MQENLEITLENRTQKLLKKYLWKIEPYLSKILFFLSIIIFFIDNLILRINYSRIFDPEFQGDLGIVGSIMMISMILGAFIVFPLYPYFKLIRKELGPKSTQAYELYVSISLLITNFILNTFETQEYGVYIFVFGSMSIILIGFIFIYSNEERFEDSISDAINPSQAYITMNSLLENQAEILLKRIAQIDKNIQEQLRKSIIEFRDKKEIYNYISIKTGVIEDYVFLKKRIEKIKKFFEEYKETYKIQENRYKKPSDCEKELKFRVLLHNRDKKKVAWFFAGFFTIFLGISVVILPILGDPANAPPWTAFILIPLGIFFLIYGYRSSKETKLLLKDFEDFIEPYITGNSDETPFENNKDFKIKTNLK